jgi:enoyl-CoA hydratase/carnithine racemase
MNEPAAWNIERDPEGIVWLTLDKPGTSANVLSSGVLRELDGVLQDLSRNPPAGVVVLSGKKSGFIAGADINEFTGIASTEDGFKPLRAAGPGPSGGTALPERCGDPWVCARGRARAGPGLPLSRCGRR